jgi:hypothetical protein
MADTIRAEQMSFAVKSARFVITLQVAFALVGTVAFLGIFLGSNGGGGAWLLIAIGGLGIVIMALLGTLLARWLTRKKWVRVTALIVEGIMALSYVYMLALESDLRLASLLNPNVFLPVMVVALLLSPTAGTWFNR